MPENLDLKFLFDVLRESGVLKFQNKVDFISKVQIRPLVWKRSKLISYGCPEWLDLLGLV